MTVTVIMNDQLLIRMKVESDSLDLAEEKLVSLSATLSPMGLAATEDTAECPKSPFLLANQRTASSMRASAAGTIGQLCRPASPSVTVSITG